MAEKRHLSSRGVGLIALAAVAGMLAGTIAVYVMQSGNGNAPVASADCEGALAAAGRAASIARGAQAPLPPPAPPPPRTPRALRAPARTETTLAAFAGKTTLFNLWATWCVPCRTEMPALDRLELELGGDDFQVVAVNIDVGSQERARAFLAEIGVKDLAFYSDPTSAVFRSLRGRGLAFGLPTTLLVDGEGCRIGVVEGPAAWDSQAAKGLIRAAMASG